MRIPLKSVLGNCTFMLTVMFSLVLTALVFLAVGRSRSS